jgi:hypothetical protein
MLEKEKELQDKFSLKKAERDDRDLAKMADDQKELLKAQEAYNLKVQETVKHIAKWAATMVVLKGLQTLWKNATEYIAEFYDKMNEIRIVTGMTQQEADALGESYRRIAQEMSVSSSEIATAAVEFWRQG